MGNRLNYIGGLERHYLNCVYGLFGAKSNQRSFLITLDDTILWS